MGFLDHSTNNIIVDAVLTDRGRQALANGTFNVTQFSLGDDEVDYTIIEKFGRTVGKEKIIKNTPVFEAQTLGELALKHKLLSVVDPTVIYLPTVTLSGDVEGGVVTISASSSGTTNETKTVTLTQQIQGVTNPAEVLPVDTQFYVEVPHRFLRLVEEGGTITPTESRISKSTNTATYSVTSTVGQNAALPTLSLTFGTQGLDDTIFNTFGTTSSKDRIDCVVGITGKFTGLRTTISFIINK